MLPVLQRGRRLRRFLLLLRLLSESDLASTLAWVDAFVREERAPDDAEVEGWLAVSGGLTPRAALDLYRNQHWYKAQRHLAEQLPTVARYMGTDAFRQVGLAYLRRFPPRGAHMGTLKDAWPDFIVTQEVEQRDWLGELARLDIAVFDLAACPVPAVRTAEELLADPSWITRPLVPVEACRFLSTQYPVYAYYRNSQTEVQPLASHTVLLRTAHGVSGYILTPPTADVLRRLVGGETVASLPCFTLRKWQDWLETWVRRGLFAAV